LCCEHENGVGKKGGGKLVGMPLAGLGNVRQLRII